MSKIYLASKESIDSLSTDISSIKTTVGTINTNASNASTYSLNVQNRLGTSTDTASQTGTTVQSKLKYVANTIGSTNDTGGTQTGGTAMAKLNNIINTTEGTNTHVANLVTSVGTNSDSSSISGASLQSKLKYVVSNTETIKSNAALINKKVEHAFWYIGTQSQVTGQGVGYKEQNIYNSEGTSYTGLYIFPYPCIRPTVRFRSYSSSSSCTITNTRFLNIATNSFLNSNYSGSTTSNSTTDYRYIIPTGYTYTDLIANRIGPYYILAKNTTLDSPNYYFPKGFIFLFNASSAFDAYFCFWGLALT